MATSSENRQVGVQVEKHRARERGRSAEHVGTDGWFDVEDDGTPVEVKSTTVDVDNPTETRPGRYQLDHHNHRNLVDHSGEYDFVLRNDDESDDHVVASRTMKAEEIDELVNKKNRKWPTGSKLKISWKDIHPEVEL